MKNRHAKDNTGAFQLFHHYVIYKFGRLLTFSNISLPVGQSSRIICHRCITRHEGDKELEINNIPKLTHYPIITPMIMTEASSSASAIHTKQYKSYFSPANVERLSAKQRGKLSVSREERVRQQACGFIDAVGVRCGLYVVTFPFYRRTTDDTSPRRTIATAQTLYMRFHLFFPYKDFSYIVGVSGLSQL